MTTDEPAPAADAEVEPDPLDGWRKGSYAFITVALGVLGGFAFAVVLMGAGLYTASHRNFDTSNLLDFGGEGRLAVGLVCAFAAGALWLPRFTPTGSWSPRDAWVSYDRALFLGPSAASVRELTDPGRQRKASFAASVLLAFLSGVILFGGFWPGLAAAAAALLVGGLAEMLLGQFRLRYAGAAMALGSVLFVVAQDGRLLDRYEPPVPEIIAGVASIAAAALFTYVVHFGRTGRFRRRGDDGNGTHRVRLAGAVALLFAALPLFAALSELDSNLSAQVTPGAAAHGAAISSSDELVDAVATWQMFHEPQLLPRNEPVECLPLNCAREDGEDPSALGIFGTYLLLDSGAFVPLFTLALFVSGLLLWRYATERVQAGPLRLAIRALPVLALVDHAENFATLGVVEYRWRNSPPAVASALEELPRRVAVLTDGIGLLTVAKWVLVAAVVIPLVAHLVAELRSRADVWQGVVLLRVTLVLPIFVLVLTRVDQMADVLRRLAPADSPWTLVFGFLAVMGAAMTARAAAWVVERHNDTSQTSRNELNRTLRSLYPWIGLICLVAGFVLLRFHQRGLAIPLLLIGVVELLSWPLASRVGYAFVSDDEATEGREVTGTGVIGALAGAAIVVFVGVQMVTAGVGFATYDAAGWGLVAAGGVVCVFATALFILDPAWRWDGGRRVASPAQKIYAGVGLVMLLVPAGVVLWPGDLITRSQTIGTLGVAGLFVGFLAVVGGIISVLIESSSPARSARFLGFRRTPLFVLLVVWTLMASMFDTTGEYHDARIREGTWTADSWVEGGGRSDALADWIDRCEIGEGRAVPLVFVSASGGGIRAAYWTAAVLKSYREAVVETMSAPASAGDDAPPAECYEQPIFLASGVSGGSVGLVADTARYLTDSGGEEVRKWLGDDYLAPAAAQLLFADLVRAWILWDADGDDTADRAELLERAWEKSWGDEPLTKCGLPEGSTLNDVGFLQMQTSCPDAPRLVLNGTVVKTACTLNISIFDNPGAEEAGDDGGQPETPRDCQDPTYSTGLMAGGVDIADVLCESQDLPLSTAALLSARFPLVSPAGRIEVCGTTETIEVVDGGYVENSGAGSIVELMPTVLDDLSRNDLACVVPVYLQIDNGYVSVARRPISGRTTQLIAPLSAVTGVRAANESAAQQEAFEMFDEVSRVEPIAHPGVQAPLGWVLSDAAQRDLDDQLERQQPIIEEFARLWAAGRLGEC